MYTKRDKNKDYKYNVQKSSRHVISRVCNDLKISEKNVHHKVGMKYPICRSKRGKDIQFKYDSCGVHVLHANSLARRPEQVKLDSDKRKL
jgi:hypothetical protein